MRRLNYLVNKLTAFKSFEDLKASTNAGYVPTIYHRDRQHSELIRSLRSEGITVWTGS